MSSLGSCLLVNSWPHPVGQNHFFVKMLLNRDSAIQIASKKFCTIYESKNSVPCQPSGWRDLPSERPPSSVLRSFELFQSTSVWTFQQHVQTILSVRPAMGFPSKTQIWEVCCNRPDALIHKASIAFKIQTSGRACIRYGNCVHQINRPDDKAPPSECCSI
jgi:hypothetical protein